LETVWALVSGWEISTALVSAWEKSTASRTASP